MIMNKYTEVGLYDHNVESYEKIKKGFSDKDIVSIIHATGTGKSFNALQLAYDNKNKKTVYIVPSTSIIEHLKEIINENDNLNLGRDFPNLEFRTYQSLINMSEEELTALDMDILIVDEFHHIGAPVWGQRIKTIVESHENAKILGMSAYTVRDRGTSYERDMVNPDSNELFSNSVVSRYDICDAIIDGVLPKPIYKSGYVYLDKTVDYLEERLSKLDHNSKDYKELAPMLKDIKRRLHEAPTVKDIFKKNIKPDGKYIYFCPPNAEDGKNDIETIMQETQQWIKEMGLKSEDYEFYVSTSKMGDLGNKNRIAFYNDEDLEGNQINKKLRIMFTINQYNEGVHVPGIDGVIMGRQTQSDIVYFEQLGRGLAIKGRNKEEYDRLYLKSKEELVELCNNKEIKIKDIHSKEEMIEKLLAPTIIDLANNIGYIKQLENNLKDRVKDIQNKGNTKKEKRIIHLNDTSFDIDMINEDLFSTLKYMNDRLSMTWDNKYELAKIYYEHYGNLEIPVKFRTTNGIEYDENGIALGRWIGTQRQAYQGKGTNKITEEQIKKLEQIGMRFETYDKSGVWNEKYNLAKMYYEHYGNLEVPVKFKTTNGIEYDENGIAIGEWLKCQRRTYQGKRSYKIIEERIKKLEKIGMRFETYDKSGVWNKKYNLAKMYYEHYGNLEVPVKFKTTNGIDYDEKGIALGTWIDTQRQAYQGKGTNQITEEQIKKLEKIGMRFEICDRSEVWNEKYNLAKIYYEHYGNLEIPQTFKTTNGVDSDENGITLGIWISTQRQAYQGKSSCKITEEQIRKLEQIGMRFETYDRSGVWNKKYNLAKMYYEHYGNLEIPVKFKTTNGIDYDEKGIALGIWISTQRQSYQGKGTRKITEEQIKKLEQIGMRFEIRSEVWNEKYNLAKIYYEHYGNLKIPQAFKTTNGIDYDENGIALGTWISTHRLAYQGKSKSKITEEQIEKLEQIGHKWYPTDNKDKKAQTEQITSSNTKQKQIEILNRVKSYLNNYDSSSLPTKNEINQGMLHTLNTPRKIKK